MIWISKVGEIKLRTCLQNLRKHFTRSTHKIFFFDKILRVLRIPISALSHHSTLLGKRKHNALRDEHWKWFPDIFHKGLLTLGSLSWYATMFYFTETFLFSIPQKITYLLLFYTKEHQNIFFLASRKSQPFHISAKTLLASLSPIFVFRPLKSHLTL